MVLSKVRRNQDILAMQRTWGELNFFLCFTFLKTLKKNLFQLQQGAPQPRSSGNAADGGKAELCKRKKKKEEKEEKEEEEEEEGEEQGPPSEEAEV